MIAGCFRNRILAARQPQGATSCHTGNYEWRTCPRSLRGGYRGGVKPATFRTEGGDHHHSTNHAHKL